jgi:hypothetical protein
VGGGPARSFPLGGREEHICQTHFRNLSVDDSSCRYHFCHTCSAGWLLFFITGAVVHGQSVKSFMIIHRWHLSHSPTIYQKRCDVDFANNVKQLGVGSLIARLGLMYQYKIQNYN